jgi:uncharacterized protein
VTRATRGAEVGHERPTYTLECRTEEGAPVRLQYSPYISRLMDEGGASLIIDRTPFEYEEVDPVSPANPGWKSRAVNTLKIQLGLRCNYSCGYCNQSSFLADSSTTSTADAVEFLEKLPAWLEGDPARIEFWGGEPLVYFAKLRRLVPALRERFPAATLFFVTNGSLLDEEILSFIEHWDIFVAVSHDGPGQHLRGPDPFQEPVRAHWLRELWRRRGGGGRNRVVFNVVLTPANADIRATRAWLAERIGDKQVAVTTEGAVLTYDDATLKGPGRWSAAEYQCLHDSIVAGFEDGEAVRYDSIRAVARDFIQSLQRQRPASAVGQKCGMDEPEELAVDLKGNVMTCQNTGAHGKHHLGNVAEMDAVQLTTSTHWSLRESCSHCPVVQLCRGGCMFLHGEHFAQSCENQYRYNLAILSGVIRSVTGLTLERISGDIRRPPTPRIIPITSASAVA